jgi:hypothetical protein
MHSPAMHRGQPTVESVRVRHDARARLGGLLALQQAAGNRAVSGLVAAVQRCGDKRHPSCPCAEDQDAQALAASATTRPVHEVAQPPAADMPLQRQRQNRDFRSGSRSGRPTTPSLGACHPAQHDHRPAAPWSDLQRGFQARCGAAASDVVSQAGNALDDVLHGRMPRAPHLPDPRSSIDCACAVGSPRQAALAAMPRLTIAGPLATSFYLHFLGASGADMTIDVADMITRSSGVREKIRRSIAGGAMSGITRLDQSDYGVDDFQFAYGAIDCVRWRALPPAGRRWRNVPTTRVEVSMLDYYEFHPERTGVSQCAHAACVDLVSTGGAKNFWMRGNATVTWAQLRS